MKKNILIIGSGAIGAFYGGILARSDKATVSVVTKTLYEHVRDHGFVIKSSFGDSLFVPHCVYSSTESIDDVFDYVIVTTKVLPSVDIKTILTPVVSSNTVIVLIQNGINIEAPVYDAFPNHCLLSGLAFICVSRDKKGVIHHQDYGRLMLGRYPSGGSDNANWLQCRFQEQGLPCRITEDVLKERWKKLIWNAAFNPLSVLANKCDTATLLSNPLTLHLVHMIMKEVQTVAKAEGVMIEDEILSKNIEDTKRMTPYKTSMLLDIESGRAIEKEAIIGNCIQLANKHAIAVPHLNTLYGLLAHF